MTSPENIPVHGVQRWYKCDCGGNLELVRDSVVLTSYPAQYPHKCGTCKKAINLYEPNGQIHFVYNDGSEVYQTRKDKP